jgi:hypothetical protein
MKSTSLLFNRLLPVLLALAITGNVACKKEKTSDPQTARDIERIALMLDYEVGYGGYIYPVYNPYVFFKDGAVVKEPYIPLDEIKTNAVTTDVAYNWGTWKINGSKVNMSWHDGNSSDKDWPGSDCIAAGSGEKIQGAFGSFSGGGNLAVGGDVGVLDYSNMSFTNDGWFTNTLVGGGGNSSVTAYSELTTAGRYSINGYAINLTFNNGDKKRLFFCFYGNDKRVFRIAGRAYTE